MVIFVNATAASEIGGLKTIVDQFIDGIQHYDNENNYYIFVSPEYTYLSSEKLQNCHFIKVDAKATSKRLKWDYFGMKKWSKTHNVYPDKIVSLQNTGVRFNNVPQIIYLHTPIPFVKYNWSFFEKNERRLWFYKKIYPYFIKSTLNKNTLLVVQSNWLKEAVSKFFNISKDNVLVNIPSIHKDSDNMKEEPNRKCERERYFYPAADYKYKNHKIVIDALKLLKANNLSAFKNTEVVFTLDKNSYVYDLASNAGVLDNLKFVGKLDKVEMINMYQSSNAILFPSYIETFGLPLIEAAALGKTIYCSEETYAQEVIGEYEGVRFINPFIPRDWEKVFVEDYREYNPFNRNQLHESWRELFRRITHEAG
ncbi:glycosyltransferase [Bacillus sp. FJAT-26377]|nr:glycosyltransferase [Bacillus sp. FJAT-26377]